ncbi:MAG: hypothetical protein V3T31_01490, partial [candidate division Zixibacteria bacterium]
NESVKTIESVYTETIDSLAAMVVAQDTSSATAKEESVSDSLEYLSDQPKAEVVDSAEIARQAAEAKRKADILTYYRGRCDELPKDLSAYEKRIALAEIREDTAEKFKITLDDLTTLREKNKSQQ